MRIDSVNSAFLSPRETGVTSSSFRQELDNLTDTFFDEHPHPNENTPSANAFNPSSKNEEAETPEFTEGEQDVDELYSCVRELTLNPDYLLKAKKIKYFTIFYEDLLIAVYTKSIVLPSRREIYVGNVENRMIVFYKEIYHLEYAPVYRANFTSNLLLTWAQLSFLFLPPLMQHYGTMLINSPATSDNNFIKEYGAVNSVTYKIKEKFMYWWGCIKNQF